MLLAEWVSQSVIRRAFQGSSPAGVSLVERLVFFILCFVASVLFARPISAQSMEPRPVARLITSTADERNYSSPKRANVTPTAEAGNTKDSPSLDEATKIERRAFEVTNGVRAKRGLPPLTWDAQLCLIARAHSESMARLGFFAHTTPAGLRLRDRARAKGLPLYKVLGENIAYNQGYDDPGAFAVERWMVSSGHRANILNPEFRASAIGTFVSGDGTVYLTQIFILR